MFMFSKIRFRHEMEIYMPKTQTHAEPKPKSKHTTQIPPSLSSLSDKSHPFHFLRTQSLKTLTPTPQAFTRLKSEHPSLFHPSTTPNFHPRELKPGVIVYEPYSDPTSTDEEQDADASDLHFQALLLSLHEPEFIASLNTKLGRKEIAAVFAVACARDLAVELGSTSSDCRDGDGDGDKDKQGKGKTRRSGKDKCVWRLWCTRMYDKECRDRHCVDGERCNVEIVRPKLKKTVRWGPIVIYDSPVEHETVMTEEIKVGMRTQDMSINRP